MQKLIICLLKLKMILISKILFILMPPGFGIIEKSHIINNIIEIIIHTSKSAHDFNGTARNNPHVAFRPLFQAYRCPITFAPA